MAYARLFHNIISPSLPLNSSFTITQLTEEANLISRPRTSSLTMDRLPQELMDHISKMLLREDLKNTLLLPRQFQFSAEKYSGALNAFGLHAGNAEDFIATYSGHQFHYLRNLSFTIQLPRVNYKYPITRDGPGQLKENDESLTR